MKTITLYQCELCNLQYSNKTHALECEQRGPGKVYPIGCIYGDHAPDTLYGHMTFAVRANFIDGHSNFGSSWACRDTGYGDSLGDETCGGASLYLNEHHSHLDPSQPHFQRMVKWLKEHNIEITVWDGVKAIPYSTFLEKCEKIGIDGGGL